MGTWFNISTCDELLHRYCLLQPRICIDIVGVQHPLPPKAHVPHGNVVHIDLGGWGGQYSCKQMGQYVGGPLSGLVVGRPLMQPIALAERAENAG